MLLNLAWATGETIGAPVAASLSQATSDAVPLLILAAIMVLTLIPVSRARLGPPSPGPSTPDHGQAQDHGQDQGAGTEVPERIPARTG